MRSALKIFVRKPKGERSLQRLRHRQEDNIEMDLGEILCEAVNWIQLIQDRVQ
jgi:hypothetical protein